MTCSSLDSRVFINRSESLPNAHRNYHLVGLNIIVLVMLLGAGLYLFGRCRTELDSVRRIGQTIAAFSHAGLTNDTGWADRETAWVLFIYFGGASACLIAGTIIARILLPRRAITILAAALFWIAGALLLWFDGFAYVT